MIILLLPLLIAIIVVLFVAIVRASQSWRGGNIQSQSMAYVMLGLAVILDILVITLSISVCSYATRQGLEITGDALRNAEVLRLMVGGSTEDQSVTVAGIWGFIIPLISWVCAHGVVLGIVESIRQLGPILIERETIRRQGGSALAIRAANRLRKQIQHLCGFVLVGIASIFVFQFVISFDKLLFQYQIIDSSLLRKILGGRGWSVHYSPSQLTDTLRGTFLGQLALHAGDFYVVCLFITAFLLVIALHRAMHAGENTPQIRQSNPTFDILTAGRPPIIIPPVINHRIKPPIEPPTQPPGPPEPPATNNTSQTPVSGIILENPR
jgi:hypothetical protein